MDPRVNLARPSSTPTKAALLTTELLLGASGRVTAEAVAVVVVVVVVLVMT